MRRFFLTFLALLLIWASGTAQPTPALVEGDGPTVLLNSDTLFLAWAGGLHNPQVGAMDWNGDGSSDIWVFEKVGQRLIPLVYHTPSDQWKYRPEFRHVLPGLSFFALPVDWNQDGKMDVAAYRWDGLQVFINATPPGQSVQFNLPLRCISQYGIGSSGLFVPRDDIPGIADLDQDGDLDVLTFPLFGSCLEWHKNLSVETFGTPDSTNFELSSAHWGNFKEGVNINTIVLNDSCQGLGGLPGPLHSGAGRALLATDFTADGLVDIAMSEGGSLNMAWMKNGGSLAQARMTELHTDFPATFGGTPFSLDIFPAAFYSDANSDAIPDLILSTAGTDSPSDASGTFVHLNIGAANQPLLPGQAQPFLQHNMMDLGSGAYPDAGDLNADGIQDLVIGSSSKNGQTATLYALLSNPDSSYTLGSLPGNNGSNLNTYDLVPALGDLDADGDLDLTIGTQTGSILLIRNLGSPSQALFSMSIETLAPNLPQTYAAPELFDADNDGDLDMLVGGRDGRVALYRNTGNPSNPQFGTAETLFLGQIETVDPSVGSSGYAVPRIFYNQGQPELMLGTYRGTLWHYSNLFQSPGQFNPTFTLITDRLGYADAGLRSAPAVLEQTGQVYPDIALGTAAGGLLYYKGIEGDLHLEPQDLPSTLLFPNPARVGTSVQLGQKNENQNWSLWTILGQKLQQGYGSSINTQDLNTGIYYVVTPSKNGNDISRLVIQN